MRTTEYEDKPEGECLLSDARMHVDVLRSTQKILLDVNEIFDASIQLRVDWNNNSPLFVGNTLSKVESCPVPLLFDELKYYDAYLSESSIFSESFKCLESKSLGL